jgi:hypothetical protein
MKTLIFAVAVAALILSSPALAGKGNGLPPGPRYVLNVIAFDRCPAGDFLGSNRHMIAVQAGFDDGMTAGKNAKPDPFLRNNDILLSAGDFGVIDGNGCDAKGAAFRLPANPFACPDPTLDENADGNVVEECLDEDLSFQEYEVYVRLVGRPGTGIDVRTCGEAIDPETTEEVIICSNESVARVRMTGKGKLRFENYTMELTTVLADVDLDGDLDRVGLFDPALQGYFWNWNTSGRAHAQLVFIPIPD